MSSLTIVLQALTKETSPRTWWESGSFYLLEIRVQARDSDYQWKPKGRAELAEADGVSRLIKEKRDASAVWSHGQQEFQRQ